MFRILGWTAFVLTAASMMAAVASNRHEGPTRLMMCLRYGLVGAWIL